MIRGFCSDLPASGIARNLVSPATVHSAPNTVGTGLALKIGSREASPIRNPGRAGNFNQPLLPGVRATGGRVVERVGSDAPAIFISLGRELGGETAQDFAKWLPSIGSLHGHNLGESHAREVVNPCQGLGNVCRA
jgi:hypothetical protein